MKKILLTLAASVMTLTACTQKEAKPYTLQWDLSMLKEAGIGVDSIVVTDLNNKMLQKATDLKDYKLSLNGTYTEPQIVNIIAYLSQNGEKGAAPAINCILEGDTITVLTEGYCKGTPLNDSIASLFDKVQQVETIDQLTQLVKTYVKAHKADLTAPAVLTGGLNEYISDANILEELWNSTSDEHKKLPNMVELRKKIDAKIGSAEGHKFIDFEAEYNGKIQKLSDYVGKGQYVLVDFWASWCGPCRHEIPNLIAIYNKYKGDKFNVLGVATWDKPEKTLEAIQQDKIPYPQIMNAQKAGSDAYNISGIPEIILFGPDGTILKRGLRGDAIETAVKEALGL